MNVVSDFAVPNASPTGTTSTRTTSAFDRDLLEILWDIADIDGRLVATCARGLERVVDHELRFKLSAIKADVERQLRDVARCTTALDRRPAGGAIRGATRHTMGDGLGRLHLLELYPFPSDDGLLLRDVRAACQSAMQAYERLHDQFRGYGFAPVRVLIRRGLQARREQWGWCSRRVI